MVNSKVRPEWSVGAQMTAALDERWDTFLTQLRRNRRRCTEPSIHDLRVATRRMIAALDAAGTVLPGGPPEGARRTLRRLLKSFNALRDAHIQFLFLRGVRVKFPVLTPFLASLRARERKLVREAAGIIGKVKTRTLEREIAHAAESLTLLSGRTEAEQAARAALIGAAASAFARAFGLRRHIAPGEPASIHALRVAFKKFRYMAEVLAPLLPGIGKKEFKEMNAYQTRMGKIQDLVAVGKALSASLPGRDRAVPASLLPVHQFVMQHRSQRIEAFMREADEILTFWQVTTRSTNGALHPSSRRGGSPRKRRLPQR